MTIRYLYIRDEKRTPVACLAYRKLDSDSLEYGLSVLSQEDKFKFNRKLARTIAAGRMEMGSPSLSGKLDKTGIAEESPAEMLRDLLDDLVNNEEIFVPQRRRGRNQPRMVTVAVHARRMLEEWKAYAATLRPAGEEVADTSE